MTFSIGDIVEKITIRFPNNKIGRHKKSVKSENVKFRVIRYLNMGKCFEISLQQFNEPLESIEFNLKMPSYIYVNSVGQWHDRDSYSHVVVKGNCLWIELTYEIINRTLEGTCRRRQTIVYPGKFIDIMLFLDTQVSLAPTLVSLSVHP